MNADAAGTAAHPRAAEQRAAALCSYRERGVGVLRGLLPATPVQALVEESERLWRRFEPEGAANVRIGIRTDAAGLVTLNGLDPVSDVSGVFAGVSADPNLVSLAEAGLGTDVTTMKDKLIYKGPRTPGFGLHRDGDYNTPKTGVPGHEVLTICIALDAVTRAKGPIEFFPDLRHRPTPSPPGEPRDVDESATRGLEPVRPDLAPGDALLFDSLVPHCSDTNTSDASRRVFMVTYVPARYANARERYYAARIREQSAARRELLSR